jgi:hypothetical protein
VTGDLLCVFICFLGYLQRRQSKKQKPLLGSEGNFKNVGALRNQSRDGITNHDQTQDNFHKNPRDKPQKMTQEQL